MRRLGHAPRRSSSRALAPLAGLVAPSGWRELAEVARDRARAARQRSAAPGACRRGQSVFLLAGRAAAGVRRAAARWSWSAAARKRAMRSTGASEQLARSQGDHRRRAADASTTSCSTSSRPGTRSRRGPNARIARLAAARCARAAPFSPRQPARGRVRAAAGGAHRGAAAALRARRSLRAATP